MRIGLIEGGGTKFMVGAAEYDPDAGGPPQWLAAPQRIPTTDPEQTLSEVIEALRPHQVTKIGFGCFGPLDLEAGRLLDSPKAGWSRVDVCAPIRTALDVPVALDTDVNAAALAEQAWGAAQGVGRVLYVTIGTGVGAGFAVQGRSFVADVQEGSGVRRVHPEMGHQRVPRLRLASGEWDDFAGVCPFHGDCLEGLVSGPALEARTELPGERVLDGDAALLMGAAYAGIGLANLYLTLCPERVVVGGGVYTGRPIAFAVLRAAMAESLGDYVAGFDADEHVLPAALDDSGLLGAALIE